MAYIQNVRQSAKIILKKTENGRSNFIPCAYFNPVPSMSVSVNKKETERDGNQQNKNKNRSNREMLERQKDKLSNTQLSPELERARRKGRDAYRVGELENE